MIHFYCPVLCLHARLINRLSALLFLLAGVGAAAQNDSAGQKLVQPYTAHFKAEKEWIYTQLNKNIYFPGEQVWFKTYVLDDVSRRPFLGTKNLYAELWDPSGTVIQKKLLFVSKGTSFGNFALPDSLAPGHYLFRAYTGWSRNFGKEQYFTREVVVPYPGALSARPPEQKKYTLRLFPESGVLLAHVENMVGFHISDAAGYGVAREGVLKINGKVAGPIRSNEAGMGTFQVPADAEGEVKAELYLADGSRVSSVLAEPVKNGLKLTLKENRKDSVTVTVRTNFETLRKLGDEKFYLMIHRLGEVHQLAWIRFVNRMQFVHFTFSTKDIPAGVSHITLFDSKYQPIADRAFFVDREAEQPVLSVQAHREPDSLHVYISLKDGAGKPLPASLSVSVLPSGTVADQFGADIRTRYFLESDLKGFIQTPALYFQKNNPDRVQDLDHLLLVQGWRSYNWNRILNENPGANPHAFEQGFLLKGYVPGFKEMKDKGSREIVLFSPENDLFLKSPLDDEGRFTFTFLSLLDSSALYLNAVQQRDQKRYRDLVVQLQEPLFDTEAPVVAAQNLADVSVPGGMLFTNPGKILKEVRVKTRARVQDPFEGDMGVSVMDKVVIVDRDALTRYRSVIDLLQQKFFVRVYHEDSLMLLHVDMRSGAQSFQLQTDPILVLDGMPVPLNTLESLSLNDVKAVAVNRLGNSGVAFGGAGSIIIKTKKGGEEMGESEAGGQALKKILVKGYDLPAAFFPSPYTVPVTHPTFIQYAAVFWMPNLVVDATGKGSFTCFVPRALKELKIRIEGITPEGMIVFYQERE